MRVWHSRHTRIFYFFKISHNLRIPSLAPHCRWVKFCRPTPINGSGSMRYTGTDGRT